MKFIVSSTVLLKQLQNISGVLNTNNTLPILDNFLFKIENEKLVVSASDLETTMTTNIELNNADKDGSVAIPARLILDTLKTFADEPLTFTVDENGFGIEIKSSNGKFKLNGFNGEEFPKIPSIEKASELTLPAEALSNAITKTLFATGNDELRPVMSGVLFELSEENLTFVSTDAHKLVRYRRLDAKANKASSFIMPKKPLTLLKGILAGNTADVKIEYNAMNAYFEFNSIQLICRLIDGTYPNYEAVIPKENNNVLTIDRKSILASVKRVSIFSNKTTHQVRLKISGSELNIAAEDLDYSNEATERLTCAYDGEDIEIGFNSRFLIEMLNNLDSSDVKLLLSEPNRAGLLVPEGGDENEEVLMLVMPVMLNH
jgi:DNA polymerase-3 subunit beta